MLLNEQIEAHFIPLFQRTIQVVCEKKVIKKGKFLLFAMKSFYLTLTIVNDKGIPKSFEIPYPFKIIPEEEGPNLTLNYELATLSKDNPYTQVKLTNVQPIKKSKYYDRIVTIEACD